MGGLRCLGGLDEGDIAGEIGRYDGVGILDGEVRVGCEALEFRYGGGVGGIGDWFLGAGFCHWLWCLYYGKTYRLEELCLTIRS